MGTSGETGYLALLRGNRDFRALWMGDVVSLLGDWFNTIALYTLIERLTGSPMALGWVFIVKMGAGAVSSPLAGVIADRVDRRRLMIATDLLRAVVVLGFLLIDRPEQVGWLYGLVGLQIVLGAPFQPARNASVPNIVSARELMTANALMATTWSTILALGSALGGVATEALGERGVFLLDALTYLVSAACVWQVRLPPSQDADVPKPPLHTVAWREMRAGWSYLLARPDVGRMAMAKSAWGLGGSAMVYLLARLGPEVLPDSGALGMGLLFAARGFGTGVGPIVARALLPDRSRWALWMGACIAIGGVIYMAPWAMPWTLAVLLPVGLAHAFSAANWVMSLVLLQERSEDRFRGRVFATEWVILTMTNVVGVLASSALLEAELLTLRQSFLAFSVVILLGALAWFVGAVPAERRAAQVRASPEGR